jgi:hypothetical protein
MGLDRNKYTNRGRKVSGPPCPSSVSASEEACKGANLGDRCASAHGEERVLVSWRCRVFARARLGAMAEGGRGEERIIEKLVVG